MADEMAFHYDCIQQFNDKLYSDILTVENIRSKQKAIKIDGYKYYGYYMEKGKDMYFMCAVHYDELPFRILEEKVVDYKGDVLRFIITPETINIPAEKRMSFREMIDAAPNFNHSNPTHFKLFKIIAWLSRIDRVNARISTQAGFGKDSVVNIIQDLVDSTLNIYGATFAKLEYSLINKLIVLNELGNLKPEEKMIMQEFLLAVGAYSNSYTKRTRKTSTTQEQYDISKLSLLVLYNLPSYYTGKAQEYFDQIFTKAVIDRFIPFVFDGRITTSFDKIIDTKKTMEDNEGLYKDVIATSGYYQKNPVNEIKYIIPEEINFFPKRSTKKDELERYKRSFMVIAKYVGEYSTTQEEFDMLIRELYECYKKYDELIVTEKEML